VPTDRIIDGADQIDFFSGNQATANRDKLSSTSATTFTA
jgi:hypothetical protein